MYLETPEGIQLPLHPAGVPVRVLAFGIDLLLRSAFLALLGAVWPYFAPLASASLTQHVYPTVVVYGAV